MSGEQAKYRKGPREFSLESPELPKYDYVKLEPLSSGDYLYIESGLKNSPKRDYTLYYPVHSQKDLTQATQKGEKAHATMVVKHKLTSSEEFCIKTQAGCVPEGTVKLVGRVSSTPFEDSGSTQREGRQSVVSVLGKSFSLDAQTLYLDADWLPASSQSSRGTLVLGALALLASAASFGLPLLMRRRV